MLLKRRRRRRLAATGLGHNHKHASTAATRKKEKKKKKETSERTDGPWPSSSSSLVMHVRTDGISFRFFSWTQKQTTHKSLSLSFSLFFRFFSNQTFAPIVLFTLSLSFFRSPLSIATCLDNLTLPSADRKTHWQQRRRRCPNPDCARPMNFGQQKKKRNKTA